MNAHTRRPQTGIPAPQEPNDAGTDGNPYQLSSYERISEMHIAADFIEKIHSLKYTLETDLIACDAKWTLFVAAALSYRYDTQLKPFPPRFASEQTGYNIDALVSIINDTPKLRVVLQNIIDQNYDEFDTDVLDLLHWVLVIMRDPMLRTVDEAEFNGILATVEQKIVPTRPTHVFEVCSALNSKSEDKFRNEKAAFETKLTFYPNKLDSYFSLLHLGFPLIPTLNATESSPLPIESLRLCTELADCIERSPSGAGWGASMCGSMISCVALCQYVDNPIHVKKESAHNSPVEHILITKNNMVRVRYLLFYGSRFPDENSTKSIMLSWISRHKYALSLFCYTMLLTSIGIANSGSGHYIKHLISKKATHFLDFCKKIFVSE